MLCISRSIDEKVNLYMRTNTGRRFIGSITILPKQSHHMATGNDARLGFEFTPDVSIVRDEIDSGECQGK